MEKIIGAAAIALLLLAAWLMVRDIDRMDARFEREGRPEIPAFDWVMWAPAFAGWAFLAWASPALLAYVAVGYAVYFALDIGLARLWLRFLGIRVRLRLDPAGLEERPRVGVSAPAGAT